MVEDRSGKAASPEVKQRPLTKPGVNQGNLNKSTYLTVTDAKFPQTWQLINDFPKFIHLNGDEM